jgi:hypothetical protein
MNVKMGGLIGGTGFILIAAFVARPPELYGQFQFTKLTDNNTVRLTARPFNRASNLPRLANYIALCGV